MHLNREKTISYRYGATPSPRWLVFSRDNEIISGIREDRRAFAAAHGKDGICFADTGEETLKIIDADFIGGWDVDVRFNNGCRRIVDFSPLLASQAFNPLRDQAAFKAGCIQYGTLNWLDGEIDIAPEWVMLHGRPATAPNHSNS